MQSEGASSAVAAGARRYCAAEAAVSYPKRRRRVSPRTARRLAPALSCLPAAAYCLEKERRAQRLARCMRVWSSGVDALCLGSAAQMPSPREGSSGISPGAEASLPGGGAFEVLEEREAPLERGVYSEALHPQTQEELACSGVRWRPLRRTLRVCRLSTKEALTVASFLAGRVGRASSQRRSAHQQSRAGSSRAILPRFQCWTQR